MKWLVVMTYLNGGMVHICFGQMAHVNQCQPYLEHTFFFSGWVGIGLAAVITIASAFMTVVEFVQKRLKQRRAYVQASQH